MMKTFLLFGLLAIFLFPESVSSMKNSWVLYQCPMVGLDCYGNDIRFIGGASKKGCAKLCADNQDCVYWAWQTDKPNCWLKNACDGVVRNSKRISGYYSCRP